MRLTNTKIRQIMDACLNDVYHAKAKKYITYNLCIYDIAKDYAGSYIGDNSEIVLIRHDFTTDELLLCTALHELAHHIQFINVGETNHSTMFKEIHANLLNSAFKKGLINPSKLYLAENYLAEFKEKRRIMTLCKKSFADTKIYDIECSLHKPKSSIFKYNEIINMFYRFKENKDDKKPKLIYAEK